MSWPENPIRATPEKEAQVRSEIERMTEHRAKGLKAFDDAMHELKTRDVVDALHAFIRGDAAIDTWPGNQPGTFFHTFRRIK